MTKICLIIYSDSLSCGAEQRWEMFRIENEE